MRFDLLRSWWRPGQYGIQQADKTGLSTQATFGLRQDTHLVGQQYAWLTTIFFIGYIVGEIPGNIIMQKTSIRQSLGISMVCLPMVFSYLSLTAAKLCYILQICWGGIVMSTAGAKVRFTLISSTERSGLLSK